MCVRACRQAIAVQGAAVAGAALCGGNGVAAVGNRHRLAHGTGAAPLVLQLVLFRMISSRLTRQPSTGTARDERGGGGAVGAAAAGPDRRDPGGARAQRPPPGQQAAALPRPDSAVVMCMGTGFIKFYKFTGAVA